MSREKALQTVVAGQQAENLLDFDAEESTTSGNSLAFDGASGLISSQAMASAVKSVNPLDELMDLFNTASMTAPAQPVAPAKGMGMEDLMSPTPTGAPSAPPARVNLSALSQPQPKAEDDLMGLF